VQPPLIHSSLDPPESTSQRVSQSVQLFFHSSLQRVPILYNGLHLPPLKIVSMYWGDLDPHLMHSSWSHLIHSPWSHLSPHPKRHLNWFSSLCRAHDRFRLTDHATPSVTIVCIYIVVLQFGLIMIAVFLHVLCSCARNACLLVFYVVFDCLSCHPIFP